LTAKAPKTLPNRKSMAGMGRNAAIGRHDQQWAERQGEADTIER
jgi:hypothetical protein